MFRYAKSMVCAGALILSGMASAWVDTGHMVVAAIAKSNLKPEVLAEAERLLKIGGTAKTSDFITAACWADDIRSERKETGPWHYIDYHFRSDGKPTSNGPDAENAVVAINKMKAILGDKTKPDAERADALRFLLHFVGDIHQPLHGTARDTDEFPDGDKGGNLFKILPPEELKESARPPKNLHALWDLGGGLFPYHKRPLDEENLKAVLNQAKEIATANPRSSFATVQNDSPDAWAKESFEISKSLVYNLKEQTVPSTDYIAKTKAACQKRVAMAGYRLADLLNQVIK